MQIKLLGLATGARADIEVIGSPFAGLTVTGLVKGDPLVGKRVVDNDRKLVIPLYRLTILQNRQDALELLRCAGIVVGNGKTLAPDRESERYRFLFLGVDRVDTGTLDNIDKSLVAEQRADYGADKDDYDAQVDNVHTETAPGRLLDKKMDRAVLLRDDRFPHDPFQKARHLRNSIAGHFDLMRQGERFLKTLVHGELWLGNDLPDTGEPLYGTGDQVDSQQVEQQHEPP